MPSYGVLLSACLLACCVLPGVRTLPTIHHGHSESPSDYDFVIVGGGAAGLALGVRLSEVESQRVLVLEAGQFPEIVKSYLTPGASQQVLGTDLDWGFTTLPQESLGNRSIVYHREIFHSITTTLDKYQNTNEAQRRAWVVSLGNQGWSWESVLPYFVKSNKFVPVNVAPYQTFDQSAYAPDGPIALSYPTFVYDSSTALIEALAAQEPLVLDAHQQRVSAYDGYFKPVRGRPNLVVRPLSQVQSVILEQRNGSLTATGVVLSDYASGQTQNITACKEVVLSAGTFQTPQMLMLSGIGPEETLSEFGIQQYVINKNVGRNMEDHFYFSVIARAGANASASSLYNRIDLLQAAEAECTSNKSGPLTTPIGPTYGFRQLSQAELESLGAAQALGAQTNQAHIEYLWENIYYPTGPSMTLDQYPPNKNESFISVTAALLSPVSRGNVTLMTNSIQDGPAINVNYLESEVDQRIALGEVVPGADVDDDATLLEYIKSTLLPVWHPSGPCRMLPQAQGGVVDNRLRVYGVNGLRVVDASIIPVVPDSHIQGPVYMVAEKAADMIKQDYGLV
ncbi:Putative glucose-methanol-choline oxidoreductase, FAD/NAD(P)-binding domain superfamily [Septoria linicola]|uniref:Glucose-methanol-choline oxidoreductase, FAD/NAD(P)-binding domain superfamily n=1 Tax=Septoria linicola TaxID=215465 RepID=A0A9Q9AWX0_9PEZI|nr:putative glucose-methanol-choline oxidoreductase, FAD/NAD(P)-binding domain superfamily [Septoria linicola]USW52151.1 Putative glucose-methanol-choline oxidoreductase, FAD/NAD(P)-binding domain superfamily [Septoria linicola]